MRRLLKDAKGAVTVFVTLLIIPAMLVSGTAVDLARLHASRSILSDANQLAANSILTQYNALLYDIYGLMGVAEDDPVLFSLLERYIRVSIFGESHETGMGTLQVFYGSDLALEDISFAGDKSLREADVLRRQIEEYMKFRGPVLIVKEFLDAFEDNTIKEDTEIISEKLEIDEAIADMYDKYKELYDAIIAADKCILPIGGISGGSFGTVSSRLQLILDQFIELKSVYSEWEAATETSLIAECESHYRAIFTNIQSYVVGGQRGSSWSGTSWSSRSNIATGLNTIVENAKQQGEDFKAKFDTVVSIAQEIDGMNAELRRKIDELERKVNECSNEELKASFMIREGEPPMTIIERYRNILGWDNVADMSGTFRNGGYDYIDNKFKPMLDGVSYRNKMNASARSLSRTELAALGSVPGMSLSGSVSAGSSLAAVFAGFPRDNVTYQMPPGFLKFAEHPGENREFFEALERMMGTSELDPVKIYDGQEDASGSDSKSKQKNLINELLEFVDTIYTGLTNNTLGADYITDSSFEGPASLGLLEIVGMIADAIGNPITSIISDPLGSIGNAGDYLLLLTYCSSMFSNYTTTRPDSIGKTADQLTEADYPRSVSGIPVSPAVNYFFQSEWEYLYSGHDNAGKNLNAVTGLLFTVRLVCNYITVFSVSEVRSIVTSINTAFSWCPPIGIVLGELARAAFVAVESLIDVANLRTGHKVPIVKSVRKGEWICSPSGIKNMLVNLLSDTVAGDDGEDKEKGITYSNYMMLFFIMKGLIYIGGEADAATELAMRTADLIEWNMVNYMGGVNANEERMTEALAAGNRFRLSSMQTCFSITTTANVRMLFLSMPFAQNYSDSRSIGIPGAVPIRATDHRGY